MSRLQPKPAEAQYESMVTLLREGRKRCLAEGVPDESIAYIVRNNKRAHHADYETLGGWWKNIDNAVHICKCVLTSTHLFPEDLFDIRVVDGRDHNLVTTLLRAHFEEYPSAIKDLLQDYPVTDGLSSALQSVQISSA